MAQAVGAALGQDLAGGGVLQRIAHHQAVGVDHAAQATAVRPFGRVVRVVLVADAVVDVAARTVDPAELSERALVFEAVAAADRLTVRVVATERMLQDAALIVVAQRSRSARPRGRPRSCARAAVCRESAGRRRTRCAGPRACRRPRRCSRGGRTHRSRRTRWWCRARCD